MKKKLLAILLCMFASQGALVAMVKNNNPEDQLGDQTLETQLKQLHAVKTPKELDECVKSLVKYYADRNKLFSGGRTYNKAALCAVGSVASMDNAKEKAAMHIALIISNFLADSVSELTKKRSSLDGACDLLKGFVLSSAIKPFVYEEHVIFILKIMQVRGAKNKRDREFIKFLGENYNLEELLSSDKDVLRWVSTVIGSNKKNKKEEQK